MFAQRHGYDIRSIGSVLLQYLRDGFLVPSFQQTQQSREVIIVSWLKVKMPEEGFVLWCIVEFHNVCL